MFISDEGRVATSVAQTVAIVTSTASDGGLAGLPPSRLTTLTNPINPGVTVIRDKSDSCCSTNTEVDTHSYLNISTFEATGMTSYLPTRFVASSSAGYWSSGSFYSSGTGATVTSLTTASLSSSSSSGSHKYTFPGAVTSDIVSGSGKVVLLDDFSVLTGMMVSMVACFAFALML